MTGDQASFHRVGFHYIPPISAFELTQPGCRENPATNILLWIGGLFDTFGFVSYPFAISDTLPANWSLVQLILSSSGNSWGTTTLDHDVTEISNAVRYFRKHQQGDAKIVIMGHSTGCQDALHYVSAPRLDSKEQDRPRVDGIILQAPVSDREALVDSLEPHDLNKGNVIAQQYVQEGRPDDCLPNSVTQPVYRNIGVTARRWLSLSSPDGKGQDDMFSSDLTDDQLGRSFGSIPKGTAVLFLCGGKDEYVPEHVDPEAFMRRWKQFAEQAGAVVHPDSTRLLEGATHNLNGDPQTVVDDLSRRVNSFLDTLST
ncbi:hypothetical protein C1H76_1636 [Elsinoe australis]|uniref:Uncharacterized protein n=1 Tax=Elsinoe australis TaxID=40998 RepID=A0A4U7B988_9PEZI|nr:hypothetical protein C1H76_1636 [Elsinoe australis]